MHTICHVYIPVGINQDTHRQGASCFAIQRSPWLECRGVALCSSHDYTRTIIGVPYTIIIDP
jgi:hypothetical protein